jgi:hypothetical protein
LEGCDFSLFSWAGEKIPVEDQYPGQGISIAEGSWDIDTCYDGGKCDLD